MQDYYSIKRVSSSSLKWFEISPRYFRMMLDKELEQENVFIYKKGKMVHYYVLQPEEFNKNYVFLDYETPKSQQQKDFCNKIARFKKGEKDERLIRAYKECYSTKEADDKILEKAKLLEKQFKDYIKYIKISTIKVILSKNNVEKLENIKIEIGNHKVARDLLLNEQHVLLGNTEKLEIYNELEVYFEFLGVECKSAIDRVIIDHENKIIKLIDLKTTSDYDIFSSKVFEYKYYRQLAFYWIALHNYFKDKNLNITDYKKETYLIAVNMKEPTEISVFEITENTLSWGLNEIEELLIKIKWHFDNSLWEYPMNYYEGKGIITL